MKKKTLRKIDYHTQATPRAATAEGVPVFCSHDKLVSIRELKPNPKNPNQHSTEQVRLLCDIIRANGWRAPITVSARSGYIVKGHARRLAALNMGATQVPVDYQEYANDDEEWADLIADNRLAELANMDTNLLIDLINEINTDALPIELTGYTTEDITALMDELQDDGGGENIDDVPAVPVKAISKLGDIWELGRHRLLCGSATDSGEIARLMDGERAQLVNTDPPYGVSYENDKWDMIMADNKTGDELMAELLIPAFRNYVKHTDQDAGFYIWHAGVTRREFEDAMTATGITEKQTIVWVKNGFQMGRADYHWGHEPCFYAEKAGESAQFYGDRTNSTVWKVAQRNADGTATVLTGGVVITDGAGGKIYIKESPPKGKKIRYIRMSEGRNISLYPANSTTTAWEVSRETGYKHPTQKPAELAVRAITNSTKPGDLVIDFFGGSGSTLIGAEITGRRCNMVELDPQYCDVIITRYIELTGDNTVKCLRGGGSLQLADVMGAMEE